jgi:hypothetical protein
MITIGIDLGLTGAIVAILSTGEIEFHDMPVLQIKQKHTLDHTGLAYILKHYAIDGEVTAAIDDLDDGSDLIQALSKVSSLFEEYPNGH